MYVRSTCALAGWTRLQLEHVVVNLLIEILLDKRGESSETIVLGDRQHAPTGAHMQRGIFPPLNRVVR